MYLIIILAVRWLLPNATLTEQGINQDVVLTLRRKFFISIDPIDIKDTPAVDLLYIQVRMALIRTGVFMKLPNPETEQEICYQWCPSMQV